MEKSLERLGRSQNVNLVGSRGTDAERRRRTRRIAFWSAVVALGAIERGVLGALAVLYGVDRLASVLTGRSLARRLATRLRGAPGGAGQRRFGDGTRDRVEEASWESFPASDPPGRGVG